MPSPWPRLYPLLVLAVAVGILLARPPLTDSGYLRARIAQNLMAGQGFVYNPDERFLLTSAPLIVLSGAVLAWPLDDVELAFGVLHIGFGVAAILALYRLSRDKTPIGSRFLAPLILFIPLWGGFGGLEVALLALALLGLEADERGNPWLAGLLTGGMLLVSPVALIFALMMVKKPRFWLAAILPVGVWYAFAAAYFSSGLRALTLNSAAGDGLLGALPLIGIVAALAMLAPILPTLPHRTLTLIIFALAYSLIGTAFGLTNDATLFTAALVMALPHLHQLSARLPQESGAIALSLFAAISLFGLPEYSAELPTVPPAESYGFFGNHHEAFYLGGRVYHLDGAHNPDLKALAERGDPAGLLIATAPQVVLWPDDPPFPITPLTYTPCGAGCWQRADSVGSWGPIQATERAFGPDLRLTGWVFDRENAMAGEWVRVRLDWAYQTNKRPSENLYFVLNMLDFQSASWGFVEQNYPPSFFAESEFSTYHAIRFNPEAPLGRYTLDLRLSYQGGTLGRGSVGTIKIPPSEDSKTQDSLGRFGDLAELRNVTIIQSDTQITLDIEWLALGKPEDDYSVFVHLTPLDDLTPLAQGDSSPLGGRYPTSLWASGEIIADHYLLDISGVPAGEYVIRVGFFHPGRGRLPVGDQDYLIVDTVTIR